MKHLKGDVFGGITAAVIALPLALAFGVASGLGPVAGLYGAIVLGFLASLFGGTNTQISGPTGPMTVVIASAMIYFSGDLDAIILVIFVAGLIQILFGLFKLGRFVKFIPYPVISGFMSGIGVIIIVLEINPFIGVEGSSSVMQTLMLLPESIRKTNLSALAVASLALAVMLFTPKKIARFIPSPLLAIILATSCSIWFNLQVQTVGEIPLTLPSLKFPAIDWSDIHKLEHIFSFALTLALLGIIDTLLTSLVADSVTKTKHNPNKELIGQGIGNSFAALLGGLAGAGATMRTVINIKSGGSSKLSGMIHAVTLLLIVLFFAPIAAQIPLSVLAGILFKVGIDIIDYRFLKVLNKAPRMDMVIMLVVFILTVFVNLVVAVGVGIVMASVLTVYRVTTESNIDIQEHLIEELDVKDKKVRTVNINGAFFFGSASIFEEQVSTALDVDSIVVNCLNVPFMDISAVFTLHELILKMLSKDIQVILILKQRHINKINRLFDQQTLQEITIHSSIEAYQTSDR